MNQEQLNIIKVKELMEKAISKLGTDECEELYNTEFTFSVNHCGEVATVKFETCVEIWDTTDGFVKDLGDLFFDNDYFDTTTEDSNKWLQACKEDFYTYDFDYCKSINKTFVTKVLHKWSASEEFYYTKSDELVGWFWGEPTEESKKKFLAEKKHNLTAVYDDM